MTTTTTHYTLAIESVTVYAPTDRDGNTEAVELVELIATNADTGRRFFYIGSKPCSTRDEALSLMAAIFGWERARDGRTLDPTKFPACWRAERVARKPFKATRKYSRKIGAR